MPPPMPNPSKRITANPIRPARYRPGKAVQEEESSDEEEEEEEVEVRKKSAPKPQSRAHLQRPRAPVQQEEEDNTDEEGFVTDEEDEAPAASLAKVSATSKAAHTNTSRLPSQSISTPAAQASISQGSEEDEESESEEESDEGSSEEESSSEDEPQRKLQRPTFIRRADRQISNSANADVKTDDTSNQHTVQATSSTPDLDEQTRRLAQADLYIKDKLERDAIARSQGRKAWDDDEEVAPEAQVDDTDGVDPEAEYAAWKLRELKRLKRDREAIEAREKEIEELERRRNLTKEEREAEDRERIEGQKAEREEGRGKANYLAKYHHKGAFFQGDEMAEVLKKRDVMGARFQDEVTDKSILPEYMRIRDMTKLGKKGRTRYTDLRGEDTGRFGEEIKRWKGSGFQNDAPTKGGDEYRGVDERFQPDRNRGQDSRSTGPTGANASAVGMRREKRDSKSRSRSPRRRRRDDSRDRGSSYRPRRRSYSYSRSRSTSRTPPRRKRSPSPYADRDKRRRVEVD